MKDFPPESPAVVALMAREVKLAEFGDASLSRDQRQAAIDEANHILEKVIDGNPDDPRRFQWTFSLAQSLLYDQVEPIARQRTLRPGGPRRSTALAERARQALAAVRSLAKRLTDGIASSTSCRRRSSRSVRAPGFVDELDRHRARQPITSLPGRCSYGALSRTGNRTGVRRGTQRDR